MISDQWFQRKELAKNCTKLPIIQKKIYSTLILTMIIHKKFEANPCSGLRKVKKSLRQ